MNFNTVNTLVGPYRLRQMLDQKRKRVLLRYRYYESKNGLNDLMISTPPQLRSFVGALGWCGRAVDAMADRMDFRGFKNDGLGLSGIFTANNPDVLIDSAILDALISACSFIYIFPAQDGSTKMQAIDGSNATGKIDPTTGLLTEGYAVLERSEKGEPLTEAYFCPTLPSITRAGGNMPHSSIPRHIRCSCL